MGRHNTPLDQMTKTYVAEGTMGRFRLAKYGSDQESVVHATDGSAFIIGVTGKTDGSNPSDMVVSGDDVDIFRGGTVLVQYGGSVSAGDALTADANGRAVAASSTDYAIGFAEIDGVSLDYGSVRIQPHVVP